MIESISFLNFKALRNTTLPMGRFTLLVGPNGSGKSTALQALNVLRNQPQPRTISSLATAGLPMTDNLAVEVTVKWMAPTPGVFMKARWLPNRGGPVTDWGQSGGQQPPSIVTESLWKEFSRIRVYSLDARSLAAPVNLQPKLELAAEGGSLAGVLDQLRDEEPERFEALNQELGRLFPEFDRVLFETPDAGRRALLLRTRSARHAIRATDLSQGTLLALAILALAYLPDPPPLVGLEEPDRGIHPRLLRAIRDALYRLSYPENFGETRPPVQVVATTHSPYFLDLFKEYPEEIVIAEKDGLEARFQRLVERPDIEEILADAPLGEVWYSGVLGGVPSKP